MVGIRNSGIIQVGIRNSGLGEAGSIKSSANSPVGHLPTLPRLEQKVWKIGKDSKEEQSGNCACYRKSKGHSFVAKSGSL